MSCLSMTSHQPRKVEVLVLFSFIRRRGREIRLNRKDNRMPNSSRMLEANRMLFIHLLESWMLKDGMIA